MPKAKERTVSVCYIAGPAWRQDLRLIIGHGPIGHPWGSAERGEVKASPGLMLATATVNVTRAFDHGSVARREWEITKNGKRAKRTESDTWLDGGAK